MLTAQPEGCATIAESARERRVPRLRDPPLHSVYIPQQIHIDECLRVLTGAQDFQPVQRQRGLRFQRFELDFGFAALAAFLPAIDARFDFFADVTDGGAEELARVFEGNFFAGAGAGERFYRVTSEQLRPIRVEKLRGCEDIAPGDFATERDDYSDDVFTFQAGRRAIETPFNLKREIFDGRSHRC